MKIGIICEYNPFHNGHLYHINKIKELYPNSTLILVMSGNVTERGELSILNKWEKTEIALTHGIDLVIELPFVFSTQGADIFSYGAIKILKTLNVDTIVFGSESNNKEELIDLILYSPNKIIPIRPGFNLDRYIKYFSKDGSFGYAKLIGFIQYYTTLNMLDEVRLDGTINVYIGEQGDINA